MVDIGKLGYIFIQGLVIGAGPCLISCAPVILPYIAGTERSWQGGLRATLIFGLTRLAVYTLLGGVVGYIGAYLFQLFISQIWIKFLWGAVGVFILTLGLLMIIGKRFDNPLCRLLQAKQERNLVLLGVLIALAPCLPLVAIMTEIMLISERFYQGFLYGLAFGIGTVVSPLLLLGALAPLLPGRFMRQELWERVCGGLLIFFGLYLLVTAF